MSTANIARKDAMKNGHSAPYTRFSVNSTPMIIGAVLIGAGSLIGLCGLIAGGTAMMSETRRWLGELQAQPSVTKSKMGQAKGAMIARPSAWQRHDEMQHTHA